MTWLRHSTRFVKQSVADHVITQLTSLGWFTAGSTPFSADPITLIEQFPSEWQAIAKLKSGSLAVTLGDEVDAKPEEMGGHLVSQPIPVFFDIYYDSEGVALALACDIRDVLKGRISGTGPTSIGLTDYSQNPTALVSGWTIELDDVQRVVPNTMSPLWQVVKATATCYFNEVVV